jgi:hypothetical protein
MIDKEEDKRKWNRSIKLPENIGQRIDKLIEDKSLNYRSLSDFVIQAVEKEIDYALLLRFLDDVGRIRFKELSAVKRWEVYDQALAMTLNKKNQLEAESNKKEK